MLVLLLLCLLSPLHLSLTCYSGTWATATTNCTVDPLQGQDSCVTAVFQTPLVPGNGTVVYTCGSCSLYQSLVGLASNVTCCASGDLCQPVAPPPSNASCEALVTETACVTRSDCYWCANSIFGMGLCQSFVGFSFPGSGVPQLPAFALPLVVPPPVCATVAFQGAVPAYTVDKLTLQYLTAYGFPAIIANMTIAIGVSLDVLGRYGQTRVLNDTESFCTVDDELRSWCGINTSTPFAYCIISETWPQSDVWGWISNTTFTSPSSSLSPIYPAFCACPEAGRAYYIPVRGVDTRPHYSAQCPVETTLLAFYVLLIVAHAVVFAIIIWDTTVFLIFAFQRKKRFTIGANFFVKVLMLLYFLVALPALVVQAVPPRGRNAMFITQGILNILSIVSVYCAFAQSIFCFMQILINIQFFGTARYTLALNLFRWLFFVASGFMVVCILAVLSALSYYTEQLANFNVANLTQLGALVTDVVAPLARALVYMIMITQGVTYLIAVALLMVVGVLVFRMKNMRGLRDLLERFVGLVIALVLGLPDLAMLIMVCYFVGWVNFGPNPSPWDSAYLTIVANAWFTWALFAAQLLWLCAIAYAMRTVVKGSWLVGQFRSLLSAVTSRTDSAATGGDASADNSTVSVHSTFSVTQEVSFDDDR